MWACVLCVCLEFVKLMRKKNVEKCSICQSWCHLGLVLIQVILMNNVSMGLVPLKYGHSFPNFEMCGGKRDEARPYYYILFSHDWLCPLREWNNTWNNVWSESAFTDVIHWLLLFLHVFSSVIGKGILCIWNTPSPPCASTPYLPWHVNVFLPIWLNTSLMFVVHRLWTVSVLQKQRNVGINTIEHWCPSKTQGNIEDLQCHSGSLMSLKDSGTPLLYKDTLMSLSQQWNIDVVQDTVEH